MKRILAVFLSLLFLLTAVPMGAVSVTAETTSATIDFADVAYRTAYSTEQQVWEQNGITVTNDKHASTSNVGNYYNPARFYKGSTLTIAYPGMTAIAFNCNDYKESYVTDLQASIVDADVSADGTVVTVILPAAADSFVIDKLAAQVRLNSITVYVGEVGETPDAPIEPDEPADDNLLVNGDFADGLNGWYASSGTVIEAADGALHGDYNEDWGFIGYDITLEPNTDYVLTFDAKSINDGSVSAKLNKTDWTGTVQQSPFTFGVEWATYTWEFNSGSYGPMWLYFQSGCAASDNQEIWLDNVSLVKANGGETPDEPDVPSDPAADSVLTIPQANELGLSKENTTYTEGKYYVTGKIVNLYNTMYGNMYIEDENGNRLQIYGTYSADGSLRYDAMEYCPIVGDTVTVYGIIGTYNGTEAQMKNGWIVGTTKHEHVYDAVTTAPGCESGGYTTYTCSVCGDSYVVDHVDATGHFYDGTSDAACNVCGKVRYLSYSRSNGKVTITDYSSVPSDLVIPNTIDGYPVTAIGRFAFDHCSNLQSIVIPDSVTSIGTNAFSNCSNLQSVTIGNGVTSIGSYAFYDCYNLQSVVIPDSVTSIGDYAFYYCYNLQSVTIPDSVTSIGRYAFSDCYNLQSVYISDLAAWLNIYLYPFHSNPLYYAENLYLNGELLTHMVIPEGVTTIPAYAFYGVDSLQSVTIPDSVTSIGSYAFNYCSNLQSVTIPDSVTSIGSYTFENCYNLTSVHIDDLAAWCRIRFGNSYANPLWNNASLCLDGNRVTHVVIPDGITAIQPYAFYGCDSIWSVTIPDNVQSIGEYAFYDCYYLQSILIPDSVTIVGGYAFGKCLQLKEAHLGSGITTIPEGLFYKSTNLTSINIPDNVTSIGPEAFYRCYGLRSVTMGDNVTSIGNYAFYYCDELQSISLPAGVTSINNGAFIGCHRLRDVYYAGTQSERWNIYIGWGNAYLNDALWHYEACLHQYDDVCDADCNLCGAIREPEHLYDADCNDADCNLCGAVRDVPTHTYDHSYDVECNLCGAVRVIESIRVGENIRIDITRPYERVVLPFVPQESGYYRFTFSRSNLNCSIGDDYDSSIGYLGWYNTEMEVYLTAGTRYYLYAGYDYEITGSFSVHITYSEQRYFRYNYSVTNEQATITGWKGTLPKELVIPASIDGYPVVAIDANAFDGSEVQSVVIPEGILSIGGGAFSGCENLTYVFIPASVTTIGSRAFDSCYWLTDVYYAGDETAKWNISVGEYNERFYEATWHYNACIHVYDDPCDAACNKCGEVREDAHVYSGACDRDCNLCHAVRQAPHVYDGVCDETCNDCGMHRKAAAHDYDNACDAFCNHCGMQRVVPPHVYDNVCDDTCNVCGAVREDAHVYDNVCDDTCNVCGHHRNVVGHVYDHLCDDVCNRCGDHREVRGHVYSDTCDMDCNVCGSWRVAPHSYTDDNDNECDVCGLLREGTGDWEGDLNDAPAFVVEDAEVHVGDTFTIAIRTERNPGLVSFVLNVLYDTDLFELISYTEGDFANLSYSPDWCHPFIVNWCDAIHDNNTTNGTVVLLTFRVRNDARVGTTDISLWYNEADVYNAQWEDVYFRTQSGVITILPTNHGDLDGDGAINNKDYGLIQRYLNGWSVEINSAAADVNGDGHINNRDLGLLQRYLNGWNVELG